MREQQLKAFGQAVRHWRTGQRLSQEELASRCGFHRTYIGQIERGERNPSLLNILTLCRTLGVSLPNFFTHYETTIGTSV
ncbi:helix-turn-helix transcriptional regulator [Hymenobacter sp. ASUV-10]|uniref:Helix-turn-helix transcriptional regulator n=1 Tax=Hymenobacter aranciens TaxID=3063996 RepID=A0ABT9B696_9BACT|nr:helix-turn-helix transcriptional regulator [Hymenobacter sp. ASUV-10]MDO7873794.1 helix-turn-helix transcriptional regulator [Hymenobacter sp. ASUV-10]